MQDRADRGNKEVCLDQNEECREEKHDLEHGLEGTAEGERNGEQSCVESREACLAEGGQGDVDRRVDLPGEVRSQSEMKGRTTGDWNVCSRISGDGDPT